MKIFQESALAILLIVTSADIDAQIRSGYMIGYNISTLTLNGSGTEFETETITGIHVGIISEIQVKGNFDLRSGLLFSAKGSIFKIDTSEVALSPIYIEVPVNLKYSIGSDKVRILLFAGPYLACGIGGNKETGGELKKINFGSGENDDLKLFDIGFNFGAGLNIKRLIISAQYESGLLNLLPAAAVDTEMNSKVIGISLTRYIRR